MIKNIVFDLCGVLIDFNPYYLYRKIMKNDAEIALFIKSVLPREVTMRIDLGEEPKDIVAELIKKFPNYKEEITAYDLRWHEMLGGKIEGTINIVNELKGRCYDIYGLSNFPLSKFKELDSQYTHIIPEGNNMISSMVKLAKPDPRFYNCFLERYNLNARECLFIDNYLPFVEGGIKVGMRGIHFTSPEKLKSDLQCMEII